MEIHLTKRKHPRLARYDYSTAGAYFITICTQNRKCLLSHIAGQKLAPAEIQYTAYGKIAEEQLFLLEKRYPCLKIDQYVIMPNHIHAILLLDGAAGASPRPTYSTKTSDILVGLFLPIFAEISCGDILTVGENCDTITKIAPFYPTTKI